jgi:hypothetical protein
VEAVVRHALWRRCRDLISVAPEVAHAAAKSRKKDGQTYRGSVSRRSTVLAHKNHQLWARRRGIAATVRISMSSSPAEGQLALKAV